MTEERKNKFKWNVQNDKRKKETENFIRIKERLGVLKIEIC